MPQRVVSIFVLVAFLFTGALGAGARVDVCTEVDGTVHYEAVGDWCCHGQAGVSEGEREADDAEGCGACEHLPMGMDPVLQVSRGVSEKVAGVVALLVALSMAVLPLELNDDRGWGLSAAPVALSLPLSMRTILRC